MKPKIEIAVNSEADLPSAVVPPEQIWNVVEYLSLQRARVSYSHELHHFSVCFLNASPASAHALLDDWAADRMVEA